MGDSTCSIILNLVRHFSAPVADVVVSSAGVVLHPDTWLDQGSPGVPQHKGTATVGGGGTGPHRRCGGCSMDG